MEITVDQRQLSTDFGIRDLGTVFGEAAFTVRYSDSDPDEIETFVPLGEECAVTHCDNRSVVLRGELRKPGRPGEQPGRILGTPAGVPSAPGRIAG